LIPFPFFFIVGHYSDDNSLSRWSCRRALQKAGGRSIDGAPSSTRLYCHVSLNGSVVPERRVVAGETPKPISNRRSAATPVGRASRLSPSFRRFKQSQRQPRRLSYANRVVGTSRRDVLSAQDDRSCGAPSEGSPRRSRGSAGKHRQNPRRGERNPYGPNVFLSLLRSSNLPASATHGLRRGLLSPAAPRLNQTPSRRFSCAIQLVIRPLFCYSRVTKTRLYVVD
jgi:hypothetical protein